MNLAKLLSGTALTTTLLIAGNLPAAATNIPLGGYSGPVTLAFNNYESFLTTKGTGVAPAPAVGDENFGIFSVFSISAPRRPTSPLDSRHEWPGSCRRL